MARDHRDGAEFSHGTRRQQDDAVHQAPGNLRQRHAPEQLDAARAEGDGRLLRVGALLLHHRDQLARHERERDEQRREHDAGDREDDRDVVRLEPRAERALGAEEQHEDEARDHRRHGKRQVDQRDEQLASRKPEARDCPRRRDAERHVQRHRKPGHHRRQPQGTPRLRLGDRRPVDLEPLGEGLGEHRDQRHHEAQGKKRQRKADEAPAYQARSHQAPSTPLRRRSQACVMLIASSSTNDRPSMTVASAVAPR